MLTALSTGFNQKTSSNFFLSSATDGAIKLATVLKRRKIETIDMRLNPIGINGAVAILGIVNYVNLIRYPFSILLYENPLIDARK